MPLKHFTETVLIMLLGVLAIVTGILLVMLPPLPEGFLPGLIVLGITLGYVLAIRPVLKRSRAEYALRLLHAGPAALVLVWFLLAFLALQERRGAILLSWFTWGWTLPGVAFLFFLLFLFCLRVMRRRAERGLILALLFLPFLAFSLVNERGAGGRWNHALVSIFWQGTGIAPGTARPGTGGLDRARSSEGSQGSTLPPVATTKGKTRRKRPPRLPKSGAGMDALVLVLLPAYFCVLHSRARARGTEDLGLRTCEKSS